MRRLLAAFLLMVLASAAPADELILVNGDKLTGKVGSLVGGRLVFNSALAGAVTVAAGDIRALVTDEPIRIVLPDKKVIVAPLLPAGEKLLAFEQAGVRREIAFADLLAINPPIPKEPRWIGLATLNLSLFQTTIHSSNFGLTASVKRDRAFDTIAFDAAYLTAEQAGRTTEDSWFVNGDYKFGLRQRLYGFLNGRLNRDRIQGLDLRTLVGSGLGYKWVDTPRLKFSSEAGLSWRNEKFRGANDQSAWGFQVGYALDTALWANGRFTHDLTFFPNVADFGDNYFLAQFGLVQGLGSSFYFDIRYIIDYDSTPAPDAARSTSKFLVGIGKRF